MFETSDLVDFLDDTGEYESDESGCGPGGCSSCAGCGGDGSGETFVFKTAPINVRIEFVYIEGLDIDRTSSKEHLLDNIIADINPVLKMTGISLEYVKTPINNAEQAGKYKMSDSSSIFVNDTVADESTVDGISQNTLANSILEIVFSTAPSIQVKSETQTGNVYELPSRIAEYFNTNRKSI